jgi:glyoxalase family protein
MNMYGIHHVTAVTAHATQNLAFYRDILGLRLVKRTVNQDDTSAYHLFYADKVGTPGTDITFFDWEQAGPKQMSNDAIVTTLFRVNGRESLEYWRERFEQRNVRHSEINSWAGRDFLSFEDPEGQQLGLVDDQGAPFEGEWWDGSDVPQQFGLRGFFAVELAVPTFAGIDVILTDVLGWKKSAQSSAGPTGEPIILYAMDGGGPGKEVAIKLSDHVTLPMTLAGSVHHAAFRVRDEAELRAWADKLDAVGLPNSGIVDRYYFKSLYFRVSQGILFELATDGPGFATDEPEENLGAKLALPPFLEPRRAAIEAGLKPID